MTISRRTFFEGLGASVVMANSTPLAWASTAKEQLAISAQVQNTQWFDDGKPTQIWGYDLPLIRLKQYQPVNIEFTNQLDEPTSVHWHGMRVDNAMDGVSGLTQEPVQPGESFSYSITPKDAGTYWAHAHHETYRQLALGLYAPIIVEETQPYPVDQDILFVADDWLLNPDEQLDVESMGDSHHWSHGGRMGNFLTVNRLRLPEFSVKAGGRIRLRVMNTANSRIMTFGFPDTPIHIIAKDGQPLPDPVALNETLQIAPAERYDLVIDIPSDWEGMYPIYERSGKQPFLAAKWLVDSKNDSKDKREVVALPKNPMPESNFKAKHEIKLEMGGGAMGNLQAAYYKGEKLSVNELIQNKQVWTFNGIANMPESPLVKVKVGDGVEIKLVNDTRWPHAMHLHGHHFLASNKVLDSEIWQDTTLVESRDTKTIRFIAESTGKWLLHCHMIEHQVSGMVTYIEVEE